jgi:hypothetical protein
MGRACKMNVEMKTIKSHKLLGSVSVAAQLAASQEELSCKELVNIMAGTGKKMHRVIWC